MSAVAENMITPSIKSKNTFNPIRAIFDNLKPPTDHPLPYLNLGLGDPTVHGNLFCPDVLIDAVKVALTRPDIANGYLPSTGSKEARVAVVRIYTTYCNSIVLSYTYFDDYVVY